jgi:hypothetical protein
MQKGGIIRFLKRQTLDSYISMVRVTGIKVMDLSETLIYYTKQYGNDNSFCKSIGNVSSHLF